MKKLTLKFKNLQTNRGFAVLYTVLISVIVLAIALGITSISYQELVLSSSAKEGNSSFFAADTGAECALYLDIKQPASPTCNGVTISSTASFDLDLNNSTSCARVTITKDSPSFGDTRIESLGYNISCIELATQTTNPNPRTVERAIRVTYSSGSPCIPPQVYDVSTNSCI